jgi:predicted signal transduction protein with EAL and GGDEF domain
MLHLDFVARDGARELQDERFAEQRRLGILSAEQISLAIANVKLHDQLRDQSIRDALTGMYNRRYMLETCRREFSRAARSGQSVAVLSIDVDHFKKFNDNHGHDAGDAVLRAAAGACRQASAKKMSPAAMAAKNSWLSSRAQRWTTRRGGPSRCAAASMPCRSAISIAFCRP